MELNLESALGLAPALPACGVAHQPDRANATPFDLVLAALAVDPDAGVVPAVEQAGTATVSSCTGAPGLPLVGGVLEQAQEDDAGIGVTCGTGTGEGSEVSPTGSGDELVGPVPAGEDEDEDAVAADLGAWCAIWAGVAAAVPEPPAVPPAHPEEAGSREAAANQGFDPSVPASVPGALQPCPDGAGSGASVPVEAKAGAAWANGGWNPPLLRGAAGSASSPSAGPAAEAAAGAAHVQGAAGGTTRAFAAGAGAEAPGLPADGGAVRVPETTGAGRVPDATDGAVDAAPSPRAWPSAPPAATRDFAERPGVSTGQGGSPRAAATDAYEGRSAMRAPVSGEGQAGDESTGGPERTNAAPPADRDVADTAEPAARGVSRPMVSTGEKAQTQGDDPSSAPPHQAAIGARGGDAAGAAARSALARAIDRAGGDPAVRPQTPDPAALRSSATPSLPETGVLRAAPPDAAAEASASLASRVAERVAASEEASEEPLAHFGADRSEEVSSSGPESAEPGPQPVQPATDAMEPSNGGMAGHSGRTAGSGVVAPVAVPADGPHAATASAPIVSTRDAAFAGEPEADLQEQLVRAVRLSWNAGGGEAKLHLHPEHLGTVSVELRVEHGVVAAALSVPSEAAGEWIQAHERELRTALSAQGLHLDRLVVTREGERRGQQPPPQRDPAPRRLARQPRVGSTFELRV